MNKYNQFLVVLFLLLTGTKVRADEQSAKAQTHEVASRHFVDDLLDDAQQCGVLEEPVHIKPVTPTERWIRVVGGAVLLQYLAFKEFIADTWQQLFAQSSKGEHELQA